MAVSQKYSDLTFRLHGAGEGSMANTAPKINMANTAPEADIATEAEIASDDVLNDFGNLVASMARLLARISAIPLFKNAEIGLAEWAALSMLQQTDRIISNQLAKRLGVTRQRVHQIIAGFSKAGLVTVRTSMEDSRKNEITLTPAGKMQLNAVNAELKLLLVATLSTKIRVITKMKKNVALLMRITKVLPAPNVILTEGEPYSTLLPQGRSRPSDETALLKQRG